jgi:hypothetical protein
LVSLCDDALDLHDPRRQKLNPVANNQLIRLAELQPIGRGSHRICYPYPDHPDRCIKVLLANLPSALRAATGIVAKSLRSASAPDENELDWETYQELERLNNPAVWRHIPRCHGLVATDLGPGLVFDYIRNADGQPAPSLAQRLDHGYDEACQAAVADFQSFLLMHLIRVGDLHPSNLLICLPCGETKERLYLIDGLADRHIFWWPCFRFLRPLKVRRKIRRMNQRMGWHLARQHGPQYQPPAPPQ